MKQALHAAGAAILAATATPADAEGPAQGTMQDGVNLQMANMKPRPCSPVETFIISKFDEYKIG